MNTIKKFFDFIINKYLGLVFYEVGTFGKILLWLFLLIVFLLRPIGYILLYLSRLIKIFSFIMLCDPKGAKVIIKSFFDTDYDPL